jgi:phosphate-selective porin OprO and OprP
MKSKYSFLRVFFIILLFLSVLSGKLTAQTEVDDKAIISFEKGLGFMDPDTVFGINIRFRMQNRAAMSTVSGTDFSPQEFEANVRRLRLRFDGFLGQNNFTYYLQLSFAGGDQDRENPGIIRDAMVFYKFSPSFYIGFGQGKLPGNRQRITSSGSLQFADRSALNATFNIDRDFGLMTYYSSKLAGLNYNLKTAVSTGEGRNVTRTDDGLSYAARVEFLPLGQFKSEGDFSEGDLVREPSPKISIAFAGSYNHKSTRLMGQRGTFLIPAESPQNITTYFADIIAKYQGWAFATEFATRDISEQQIFVRNERPLYAFTGWGVNSQLSYIFPSDYEFAGRYTRVEPSAVIVHLVNPEDIFTLGVSKYLPNHKKKIQINLSYHKNSGPEYVLPGRNFWNIMFQIETGI